MARHQHDPSDPAGRPGHLRNGIRGDATPEIESDPVWSLLLKARKPEVSPFFARNVLRQVRALEESGAAGVGAGMKAFFTFPRIAFAIAAAVAAVAIAVTFMQNGGERTPDVAAGPLPPSTTDTATAPAPTPTPAIAAAPAPAPVDGTSADSTEFDIGDYQEEIQMIDYLDGLLAVQNVEALNDEALAEILF